MNFSFRRILELDFLIVFSTIALMVIGILFIYSSGVNSDGDCISTEYIKQIIWCSVGVCLMIILSFLNYKRISEWSFYLYAGFMFLLTYTRIFGRYVNGARSWIGIGDIGVQPSEFAKIAFIVYLARFYMQNKDRTSLLTFFKSLGILSVPLLLILSQPDLGTASVYIPIYLIMSLLAGIPFRYIGVVFFGGVFTVLFVVLPIWQQYIYKEPIAFIRIFTEPQLFSIVIVALSFITILALVGRFVFKNRHSYFWIAYFSGLLNCGFIASIIASKVLKSYQIMRLIVFIDPSVDPLGSGWNIIQSTTAIGSGGLWGRGFLKGTQSHYRFLPQQSTDFIFSILSEEWGFVGGLLVFGLYLLIILRTLYIMRKTSDQFGFYIAGGIVAMFAYHFMVNTGMAMGIMPITGIPLLFLSYGGSSLWTALIAVALLISINAQRDSFSDAVL